MRNREFEYLALPASDRALIERFLRVVQEWAPTNLKSIVLYGSTVKGIFPEEYDIDIVLLFSSDFNHAQLYSEVYRIVNELKPHREMHIVLKWEEEIEPSYWSLIQEEGVPLYP
ncbi:MAG: nucleotidyltransferase domain-containing protein [Halobacteriota archaeon]